MTVLILAQELDRTVDRVVLALAERGVPVFRMDTSWFPRHLELDAELRNRRWQGHLATRERLVRLTDVRSVWYRSPAQFSFPPEMSVAEQLHAEREGRIGLGGVVVSLPNQVNHPHRVAAATKPWQLVVAAECGLPVPVTRIVNHAEGVREFASATDGAVLSKLFVNGVTEHGRSMVGHTHVLSSADLEDLHGIDVTAHQLQHFIDKDHDLRVVAVGPELFAVAIHPLSAEARIDFRADYRSLRHERVELPPIFGDRVRALMSRLGLTFGCLDFVVDRSGVAHFLEVNPTGQYGWLESAAGVPITEALADYLSSPPALSFVESG